MSGTAFNDNKTSRVQVSVPVVEHLGATVHVPHVMFISDHERSAQVAVHFTDTCDKDPDSCTVMSSKTLPTADRTRNRGNIESGRQARMIDNGCQRSLKFVLLCTLVQSVA